MTTQPTSPGHLIYGETPLSELRQTIAFAIWHAVDRELGCAQYLPCTHDCCETQPAFDAEQAHREGRDADLARRKHLVALRFASEVGQDPTPWVTNAREKGATWAEIGEVLGITRQAAQMRFRTRDEWCPDCDDMFASLYIRGKIGYHNRRDTNERCSGVGKPVPRDC